MKNLKLSKRLISLLSATTIVLTASSCSLCRKNDNNYDESESSIITEYEETFTSDIVLNETSSDNTEDSEIDRTQESDLEASQVVESIDASNDESKDNSSPPSTEESKNNSSQPSTEESKNNSSQPNDETTSKEDTNESKSDSETSDSIVEESEESEITEPVVVTKLTKENINDVEAIEAFAEQKYNIYNIPSEAAILFVHYDYNGQRYSYNKDDLKYLIATLNEQYMDEDTLSELFKDNTKDEMDRFASITVPIVCSLIAGNNASYNFNNFIIDDNMKKFMTDFQTNTQNYLKNKNDEEYNNFVKSFYENTNPYMNHGESPVIDAYVYNFVFYVYRVDENNEYLHSMYLEYNSDNSTYRDYLMNAFYAKTKAKQLTK